MTGAPVPAGADSVQQVELTHELKDGTVVELLAPSRPEDRRQTRRGNQGRRSRLTSGVTINAAMMAVLAAFGYAQVEVARKPRVAVLATGSELVRSTNNPDRTRSAIPTTTRSPRTPNSPAPLSNACH
jgi:molybdopterin molybdotransferase